jgi:hypothetical protein
MWRIGFAADLFDQFQPRQSQLRLGLLPACCRKTYAASELEASTNDAHSHFAFSHFFLPI